MCESDSFIELVKKNMPKKCLKKNLTLVFKKKTTLMKWEFSRKKKSEKKNGLVDERRC